MEWIVAISILYVGITYSMWNKYREACESAAMYYQRYDRMKMSMWQIRRAKTLKQAQESAKISMEVKEKNMVTNYG